MCLSPGLEKKKELIAFENANPIPLPATKNFLCPGWANSDACHVDFSLCFPLRLSASLCSTPAACPHSTEGSASFFHATDQKPIAESLTDISQTRMPKTKQNKQTN